MRPTRIHPLAAPPATQHHEPQPHPGRRAFAREIIIDPRIETLQLEVDQLKGEVEQVRSNYGLICICMIVLTLIVFIEFSIIMMMFGKYTTSDETRKIFKEMLENSRTGTT